MPKAYYGYVQTGRLLKKNEVGRIYFKESEKTELLKAFFHKVNRVDDDDNLFLMYLVQIICSKLTAVTIHLSKNKSTGPNGINAVIIKPVVHLIRPSWQQNCT